MRRCVAGATRIRREPRDYALGGGLYGGRPGPWSRLAGDQGDWPGRNPGGAFAARQVLAAGGRSTEPGAPCSSGTTAGRAPQRRPPLRPQPACSTAASSTRTCSTAAPISPGRRTPGGGATGWLKIRHAQAWRDRAGHERAGYLAAAGAAWDWSWPAATGDVTGVTCPRSSLAIANAPGPPTSTAPAFPTDYRDARGPVRLDRPRWACSSTSAAPGLLGTYFKRRSRACSPTTAWP